MDQFSQEHSLAKSMLVDGFLQAMPTIRQSPSSGTSSIVSKEKGKNQHWLLVVFILFFLHVYLPIYNFQMEGRHYLVIFESFEAWIHRHVQEARPTAYDKRCMRWKICSRLRKVSLQERLQINVDANLLYLMEKLSRLLKNKRR